MRRGDLDYWTLAALNRLLDYARACEPPADCADFLADTLTDENFCAVWARLEKWNRQHGPGGEYAWVEPEDAP